MGIANWPRPLVRGHKGLTFFFYMEDWPEDVPLPDGTKEVVTGAGPFHPYMRVFLEPDKTVEMVAGWFRVKRPLEEVFTWYQTEMEGRGWVEEKRTFILPRWANIVYRHPETDVKVEIDLRHNPHLGETRPMIRRVTIHPWSPDEPEEGEESTEVSEIEAESLVVEESETVAQ